VADREPEPESESEPEAVPEHEPEPDLEPDADLEPAPEAEPDADGIIVSEADSEEPSLEFDAAATDVSEIFISPDDAEVGTGSGSFEAVVLGEEPAAGPVAESEAVSADDVAHTDTIAADDWSLLDDDEPAADAESVIEESPLASSEPEEGVATHDGPQADPPWVEEMFAEAEAEAERVRTAEREAIAEQAEDLAEQAEDEESAVESARPIDRAAPRETALEPLLGEESPARRSWAQIAGVVGLVLLLAAQLVHFNRRDLVLKGTVGPILSQIYGWFGATLTPRWDLTAYSVQQLGAEAEGGEATQLRVRLSLQNESQRVQPLPLLRLTLQDRYGNPVATRDLEPREYLPPRVAGQRLLEPDQRIDAELHVIDPGRAAIGFEIDACLRGDGGAIGCANDVRRRPAG
jgi:hypothetical protein